jgi:hypothetical protein
LWNALGVLPALVSLLTGKRAAIDIVIGDTFAGRDI